MLKDPNNCKYIYQILDSSVSSPRRQMQTILSCIPPSLSFSFSFFSLLPSISSSLLFSSLLSSTPLSPSLLSFLLLSLSCFLLSFSQAKRSPESFLFLIIIWYLNLCCVFLGKYHRSPSLLFHCDMWAQEFILFSHQANWSLVWSRKPVFLPTPSFSSVKVKNFDRDKWATTKVFVVTNVTVMRSMKHYCHGPLTRCQKDKLGGTLYW